MQIRTVVNLDGFFWASPDLWNDATYACRQDKLKWQRIGVDNERRLCRILGEMTPHFDGEHVELETPIELEF